MISFITFSPCRWFAIPWGRLYKQVVEANHSYCQLTHYRQHTFPRTYILHSFKCDFLGKYLPHPNNASTTLQIDRFNTKGNSNQNRGFEG